MAQFSNQMALIRHASNWIRTVFHKEDARVRSMS